MPTTRQTVRHRRVTAGPLRKIGSRSKGVGRPPPVAVDPPPLISLATDLLAVIGADGAFKRLAPGFSQAFGYLEVELLEQPFLQFVHPDDLVATSASLAKLLRREPTLSLESRFRCKDGSYRCLAWTAMPTPEGLLYAAARDVSVRLPTPTQPVPDEKHDATALAQKEHFMLTVCHDVQQPLTVILVQTQLLQRQIARGETPSTDRLAAQMAHIYAAARRTRDMAQDLLDASVLDPSQRLVLLLAPRDLVALARDAIAELELVSEAHQFVFEAEVPTLEAVVDEARMHRVLANLLTNAIKYSPNGGVVRVTVKLAEGSIPPSALLVVQDSGVGIPATDLPRIFDRYHRGSNVIGRFAGTGLGLASVRELVELHGGSIAVDSQTGHGSTFVVRLPLTQPGS